MVLYEARGYQIVDIRGIPINTELPLKLAMYLYWYIQDDS